MEKFERGFAKLEHLLNLSNESGENWWKHLLSQWRPSGIDSGADGLRLAIRNQELNLYRLGQSVGKVRVSGATPQSALHAKYVLGEEEFRKHFPGRKSGMAKVKGATVTFSDKSSQPYDGIEMLREWIERAGSKYADEEKKAVDKIISQTQSVIDVEASWSGAEAIHGTKAPRIDVVFLEPLENDRASVVFVEVKRANDPRMPQSKASQERVKTHDQLATYQRFLSLPSNQIQIKRAYSNASKVTAALLASAGQAERSRVFATDDLQVDPIPRLAIEWPRKASAQRLSPEQLRERFGDYPIAILDEAKGYSLDTAQWLLP